MIDSAGTQVFGTNPKSAFFNLLNGDQYPCGNHQSGLSYTGNPKCYLFYGEDTLLGSPVQIIMTDINYGTSIKARLLITNPNSVGWVSVNVYAYAGVQDVNSVYGNQYVGYWYYPNIYQVCSTGILNSNAVYSSYLTPNRGLWR